MDITKVLPRTSYPRCGLIIDLKCSEAEITLGEVSNYPIAAEEEPMFQNPLIFQLSRHKYFNTTYPSLFLNLEEPEALAMTAPTIGYNSNVYFVNNNMTLFEIFSFGLQLHNTSIITKEVKNWMDMENYLPSYRREERGNFYQTRLRGVTVVRKRIENNEINNVIIIITLLHSRSLDNSISFCRLTLIM